MRLLIPLMKSMDWMRIYHRKTLLSHGPMIMIVSGYTLVRNISTENADQRDWFTTSLCENMSLSLPKESVPDLRYLVVIWEVISVLWCSTQTAFTGVSRVVSGYGSCMMIISAQMQTRNSFVVVLHCVTVAFFSMFFWVWNAGDNLSSRCRIPLLCVISQRFL